MNSNASGWLWRSGIAAASAVTLFSCADIEASDMDELGPKVLAQSTGPIVTPTKQQTTTLATEQRTITITGNFGSGCEGKLKPNPEAEKRGLLSVTFDTYRITFVPPETSIYDTKDCLLRLRVSGAAGYRFAAQTVSFYGMANLLSPRARAVIDARVWWSGRQLPTGNHTRKELDPNHLGTWGHDDSFSAVNNVSRCFASDDETDEITLYTSLLLLNPDAREVAELGMAEVSAGAYVRIDFDAQRCQ